MSWSDANDACTSRNADLASVLSQEENAFLDALVHEGPGCPPGWTMKFGMCLYATQQWASWNDSIAICREADAQLVKIDTQE